MTASEARSRLAFALDYPSLAEAKRGAEAVCPYVGVLKVGLELFIKEGPPAVKGAHQTGCEVFLDLKLHDIEKTVERAIGTACSLGAKYLTIHTAGGPGMLEAAAKRADREGTGLCLLGVTVLTNLNEHDLQAVGVTAAPGEQVVRLAQLAEQCGVGGLVCSPQEVGRVREAVGPQMKLVTPGIRPAGAEAGDQKRVGTPEEAIRAGADILVVGRPIRDAASPALAAQGIAAEIEGALR